MKQPQPQVESLSVSEIAKEFAEHQAELVEAVDPYHRHVLRDRIEALESEVARRDDVYAHTYGPNSASNALAEAQAEMGGGS